jgi:hypothetical protein
MTYNISCRYVLGTATSRCTNYLGRVSVAAVRYQPGPAGLSDVSLRRRRVMHPDSSYTSRLSLRVGILNAKTASWDVVIASRQFTLDLCFIAKKPKQLYTNQHSVDRLATLTDGLRFRQCTNKYLYQQSFFRGRGFGQPYFWLLRYIGGWLLSEINGQSNVVSNPRIGI